MKKKIFFVDKWIRYWKYVHVYSGLWIRGGRYSWCGPGVRIPSTPSMLCQFIFELWLEKDENKQKEARIAHIFQKGD